MRIVRFNRVIVQKQLCSVSLLVAGRVYARWIAAVPCKYAPVVWLMGEASENSEKSPNQSEVQESCDCHLAGMLSQRGWQTIGLRKNHLGGGRGGVAVGRVKECRSHLRGDTLQVRTARVTQVRLSDVYMCTKKTYVEIFSPFSFGAVGLSVRVGK